MASFFAMGDKGCLSLFADRANMNRLFAEHISTEYRMQTQGRGRTVDEWKIRPAQFDNHWLDGLVACAVDASMQGVLLPGTDAKAVAKRERVKLSDLQRGKR